MVVSPIKPTRAWFFLSLSFTLATLLLLSALLFSRHAHAQSAAVNAGGMDLHLFRPALDSRGHFSVNGASVLGAKHYSFGMILDAGFGVLPFRGYIDNTGIAAEDAERADRVVNTGFTGHLRFNYGIADLFLVGVQLPILLSNGPQMEVPGYYNSPNPDGLAQQGIGDLTLHTKWRVIRPDQNVLGLAVLLRVSLPSGSSKEFGGEPGVSIWPSVALEFRPAKSVRLSLEAGYRAILGDGAVFPFDGRTFPNDATATSAVLDEPGTLLEYDDLITFGVGVSFRVAQPLDIVLELYGTQLAGNIGDDGALSMEALGGLKIFVQEHSFLMLGGGLGVPPKGFQNADWRATLGFVFEPSVGDSDNDGLTDDIDMCPNDAEDKDDFEDDDGCPEADNDRDGIEDILDLCPMVPEDIDGDVDYDGCPEGANVDRDDDGILDVNDKCPDIPEDRDGFEDDDGCPEADNDGDGIADAEDLCPDLAEDKDDFEDDDGCPEDDNDRDRIADVDDRCPDIPETYNGVDDDDGCPDDGKVVVEGDRIVILEKVYFRTNSATIQTRSFDLLDAVATTLQSNSQITLLEVQGHADERGRDQHNLKLTQERAASVVDALVRRGVARGRLRSAGYGEHCPIDPASTREAWERNRRVEFKIIETTDGPTGVEVTCDAGRHLVVQ